MPAPSTAVATINGGTLDLPDSANPATWTAEQRALMEFAGLAWTMPDPNAPRKENGEVGTRVVYAPAGVAQGFIAAVKRSGLDPFARQIYCAEVGGKWVILAAIDGFRAVVEAHETYEGRTPIQYTGDGEKWVEAWLEDEMPKAARVGIYKRGFRDAVYTTILWREFNKAGGSKPNQWDKMGVWMLGIRLLSHAYRDSFPQKLGGIYTREDFDGEEENAAEVAALVREVEKITDTKLLRAFYDQHEDDLPDAVRAAIMARFGILAAKETVAAPTESPTTPAEPPQDEPETPAPADSGAADIPSPENGAQRAPRKPISGPSDAPDHVERLPEDPDYEPWLSRLAESDARDRADDERGGR